MLREGKKNIESVTTPPVLLLISCPPIPGDMDNAGLNHRTKESKTFHIFFVDTSFILGKHKLSLLEEEKKKKNRTADEVVRYEILYNLEHIFC